MVDKNVDDESSRSELASAMSGKEALFSYYYYIKCKELAKLSHSDKLNESHLSFNCVFILN
jgi:hypothetical protein